MFMEFRENGTKNVRHVWSILSASSILDSETQNLTINNVLDDISINIGKELVEKKSADKTSGYAIPANMHIVTKLTKKVPNKDIGVEIKYEEIDPNGVVLTSSVPHKIDFKKQYKNLRWRTNFTPLLVNQSGQYHIRVSIRESDDSEFMEVDRIPLEVSLAEATRAEQALG
jgi:hypothetical protein